MTRRFFQTCFLAIVSICFSSAAFAQSPDEAQHLNDADYRAWAIAYNAYVQPTPKAIQGDITIIQSEVNARVQASREARLQRSPQSYSGGLVNGNSSTKLTIQTILAYVARGPVTIYNPYYRFKNRFDRSIIAGLTPSDINRNMPKPYHSVVIYDR